LAVVTFFSELDVLLQFPDGDIWIFGYGSLMWRPDFPYLEAQPALLHGYHRALCVISTVYRGTEDKPGLVLGLDRGGSCRGRVFRLAPDDVMPVMEYLQKREMPTNVYNPKFLHVRLDDGRRIAAYTFIVRRDHGQYAGKLEMDEEARLVAQGIGPNGSALDYLGNTLEHLDDLGIREGRLHRIYEMAKERACRPEADAV